MPAQPAWFVQLPRIIQELAALSVPVVDRSIVEQIFGVKRWRAVQLLRQFGGWQSGRTFLVERHSLLRQLASLRAGADFERERRRRERLAGELEKLRRHAAAARVAIPVAPEVFSQRISDLPQGVHLEPGRLTVEFSRPEQLLERLFSLAQAIANDFERFQTVARTAE
jgi:hypothetical protein